MDSMPGVESIFIISGVILCWVVFFPFLATWKNGKTGGEKKRNNAGVGGYIGQQLGFAVITLLWRGKSLLVPGGGLAAATLLSVLALILGVGSVLLQIAALKALGKQWAIAARVVEEHKLITTGPYGVVRNPIYTGMFARLLATGIAVSAWWALLAGMVIFWVGTVVRIRAEETVLRATFGEEFNEYARKVPSLFPKL
jgi:protein-S-isoprenylcysteine O-methyltransferase Ste14